MRTSIARNVRQWTWLLAHARHELAWETFAETMRVVPTARITSLTHASTDMSSAVPTGGTSGMYGIAESPAALVGLKSAFMLLDTGDELEAKRFERRQVGRC